MANRIKKKPKTIKKDKNGRWRYGGRFISESHAKKLKRDRTYRKAKTKKEQVLRQAKVRVLGRKTRWYDKYHVLYRWFVDEPPELSRSWLPQLAKSVTEAAGRHYGATMHIKFYRPEDKFVGLHGDDEFWAQAGFTPPGKLAPHVANQLKEWEVTYEGYRIIEVTIDIFYSRPPSLGY